MGVLISKLFTEGDPATVAKLENCATGTPNEVFSHFTQGQSGEHIRRVQQALQNAQNVDKSLGLPPFTVNGSYDGAFAKAIAAYKEKRHIKNFANKIDDIVGIKTILALDHEAQKKNQVDPDRPVRPPHEFPRPFRNCVTAAECPTSTNFYVRLLANAQGGEILELSKNWFAVRDTKNGLSALYLMSGAGLGTPSPIPGTINFGGKAINFTTTFPARVTDFKFCQIAGIVPPQNDPASALLNFSVAVININYSAVDGSVHSTGFFRIDTGKINVPGAGGQTGPWKLLSHCKGGGGATRHEIDGNDLVFG